MPRHKHGGGRLYDDAEVSRAAYLDRGSQARDTAAVSSGFVFNSIIAGSSIIAGNPDITDSFIDCHSVTGEAVILRSQLGHGVQVWDDARLTDVVLVGDIKIHGTAELVGAWSLSTGYGARIDRGVWRRPPRITKSGRFSITESVGGVIIGCRFKSYAEWSARGAEIGRRMNWTITEIKETLSTFDEWQCTSS